MKKIITISSGAGSAEFVVKSGSATNVAYAVSKAALNMVVAEFAAALESEGFTVLALSPGVVNTLTDPQGELY